LAAEIGSARITGIQDALHLARAAMQELPDERDAHIATHRQLEAMLDTIATALLQVAIPTANSACN